MSCSNNPVEYKEKAKLHSEKLRRIKRMAHSMEQLFTTENYKIIFKLCLGEIIDFSS